MSQNIFQDFLDDAYDFEAMEHDSVTEAETDYEADRFWEAQQLQRQERWLQSHRRGFYTEEEQRRELLEAEADRMVDTMASLRQGTEPSFTL